MCDVKETKNQISSLGCVGHICNSSLRQEKYQKSQVTLNHTRVLGQPEVLCKTPFHKTKQAEMAQRIRKSLGSSGKSL